MLKEEKMILESTFKNMEGDKVKQSLLCSTPRGQPWDLAGTISKPLPLTKKKHGKRLI